MSKRLEHVAIVGAGIAGLLTAAALAPLAARITLFESDELPSEPVARRGVPQDAHSHVLLARGRQAFEALLPGFDQLLAGYAAEEVDWAADCLVFSSAGAVPRFASRCVTRPCTRPLIEWCVRQQVSALSNVELKHEKVLELEGRAGEVVGVRTSQGVQIADFVVDAAGRRSRATEWLSALGYGSPIEQIVDAHLGYATRLFERTAAARDWRGLVIGACPPENPRGAALWPVEGDRWLVTLAGAAGHYPPTDEAGFLAFARALQSPVLYDAIFGARPASKIYGFRKTENRWRRFDRLARIPDHFVVLGDGCCAFNPIYGQGMTVAALEAQVLASLLEKRGDTRGLSHAFQRAIVPVIEPAWLLATSEDSRWPNTEGVAQTFGARASFWYINRVMALTPRSQKLTELFLSVVHMLRPPSAFGRPDVAAQVLTHAAFGRRP